MSELTPAVASVIGALITAIAAIVAQVIISNQSKKDFIAELQRQMEVRDTEIKGEINVIKTEITSLKKSQDKHNNMIERMYIAEKDIVALNEKMKTANHRIDDLEHRTA